jgi:hypothetical protein
MRRAVRRNGNAEVSVWGKGSAGAVGGHHTLNADISFCRFGLRPQYIPARS